MMDEKTDLKKIDGVSYTIYRNRLDGKWMASVHLNDGLYTHRDFLLSKIAEGKSKGISYDFSSCGILAYDIQTRSWFTTFETSYTEERSELRRMKDLDLATKQAEQIFGKDKNLMAHLSRVGADKIANQRLDLAKIGLSEEQIEKIVLQNARCRLNIKNNAGR